MVFLYFSPLKSTWRVELADWIHQNRLNRCDKITEPRQIMHIDIGIDFYYDFKTFDRVKRPKNTCRPDSEIRVDNSHSLSGS